MVYVDDGYQYDFMQKGRLKFSHMLADSDKELHAMADLIGVDRKHWQAPPRHVSHYDIAKSKREKALKYGAIPVDMKTMAKMNRRRRETGSLGKPEEADEWFTKFLDGKNAELRTDSPDRGQ